MQTVGVFWISFSSRDVTSRTSVRILCSQNCNILTSAHISCSQYDITYPLITVRIPCSQEKCPRTQMKRRKKVSTSYHNIPMYQTDQHPGGTRGLRFISCHTSWRQDCFDKLEGARKLQVRKVPSFQKLRYIQADATASAAVLPASSIFMPSYSLHKWEICYKLTGTRYQVLLEKVNSDICWHKLDSSNHLAVSVSTG